MAPRDLDLITEIAKEVNEAANPNSASILTEVKKMITETTSHLMTEMKQHYEVLLEAKDNELKLIKEEREQLSNSLNESTVLIEKLNHDMEELIKEQEVQITEAQKHVVDLNSQLVEVTAHNYAHNLMIEDHRMRAHHERFIKCTSIREVDMIRESLVDLLHNGADIKVPASKTSEKGLSGPSVEEYLKSEGTAVDDNGSDDTLEDDKVNEQQILAGLGRE